MTRRSSLGIDRSTRIPQRGGTPHDIQIESFSAGALKGLAFIIGWGWRAEECGEMYNRAQERADFVLGTKTLARAKSWPDGGHATPCATRCLEVVVVAYYVPQNVYNDYWQVAANATAVVVAYAS